MRTDPRYSRVRKMITDEAIPRNKDGVLRLCHICQRAIYFRGGFLKYLIWCLDGMARVPRYRDV